MINIRSKNVLDWVNNLELLSFVYASGVVPLWFLIKWLFNKTTRGNKDKVKESLEKVEERHKRESEIVDIKNSIEDIYKLIRRLEDERKEMRADIKSLAQEINLSTTKLETHMNDLMMTIVKLNMGSNS